MLGLGGSDDTDREETEAEAAFSLSSHALIEASTVLAGSLVSGFGGVRGFSTTTAVVVSDAEAAG